MHSDNFQYLLRNSRQVDEEMARLASKGGKVDLEDFNRLEDVIWIHGFTVILASIE